MRLMVQIVARHTKHDNGAKIETKQARLGLHRCKAHGSVCSVRGGLASGIFSMGYRLTTVMFDTKLQAIGVNASPHLQWWLVLGLAYDGVTDRLELDT